MINVIEKNIGQKIEFSVSGTRLNLNNELILDLSKYERDHDVHIDISENGDGMLIMGVSRRYVAQIDIPARKYDEITTEATEDKEAETTFAPVAFSMDNVKLTLWALEGGR